jgi:hypothetical protein
MPSLSDLPLAYTISKYHAWPLPSALCSISLPKQQSNSADSTMANLVMASTQVISEIDSDINAVTLQLQEREF